MPVPTHGTGNHAVNDRALAFTAVGKTFANSTVALQDITFEVTRGIIALLGANGAGKSTLLRIAPTVSLPSHGTVSYGGIDIAARSNALRGVLDLPQGAGVYPHLSATEFLEYAAALKGLPWRDTRRAVSQALNLVNISSSDTRALGTFSGGMRQRVLIAQARLGDPRVVIVDEPTVGLDIEERLRFQDVLVALRERAIVIFSTNIISDVEDIADRIVIMAGGRIVRDCAPADIISAEESLKSAYLAILAGTRS